MPSDDCFLECLDRKEGGCGYSRGEQIVPQSLCTFNSTAPGIGEFFNSGLSSKRPKAEARSYDLMELNYYFHLKKIF